MTDEEDLGPCMAREVSKKTNPPGGAVWIVCKCPRCSPRY